MPIYAEELTLNNVSNSQNFSHLPYGWSFLSEIDPTIVQDIWYAKHYNLVGRPFPGYKAAKAVMTTLCAQALKEAQKKALSLGFTLKVYEAYRPAKAGRFFKEWAQAVDDQKMKHIFYPNVDKKDFFKLGYVAENSIHTRGSAVDVTLIPIQDIPKELESLKTFSTENKLLMYKDFSIDMGTCYDFMDELSHHNNSKIQGKAQENRVLLRRIMENSGFEAYHCEWWHYNFVGTDKKSEPFPTTYFDFDIE
jgi:D-alanyl-D-alanine dipeptidase